MVRMVPLPGIGGSRGLHCHEKPLEVKRPTVLHVVQALRGGGAEGFVRELVPRLRDRKVDARVLCAYGGSLLTDAEAASWTGSLYAQPRQGVSRLGYLRRMLEIMRQAQ